MDVKTEETFKASYTLICFMRTIFIYLIMLIIPGIFISSYFKLFGTIVFIFLVFTALRSFLFGLISIRSRRIDSIEERMWPFVSIIVAAFQEEAVLDRTIRSVLKLDYPSEKLEILYVYESHCTDKTEEIILKYAKQDPRIKPIKRTSEAGGHAAANNYGLRFAKGEIIGIFDADQSLNSDLLKKSVVQFDEPSTGCVRGRCRILNRNCTLLSQVIALERDIIERLGIYGAYRLGGFSNFGGAQGFFKRDIFEKIGLFDEEILCEDIDLSVRLHMEGLEIVDLPDIQSWEEVPTRIKPWWAQRKRWARGWMQVWRKYNLNILKCEKMSRYKKIDTFISLSSSLSPILTIFIFPLILLSCLGYKTTLLSEALSQPLWLFVSSAPLASAILVWALDSRDYGRQPLIEIPLSLLLLPYILFQFAVNWTALMDEFILNKPSSFIKTERDRHPISFSKSAAAASLDLLLE